MATKKAIRQQATEKDGAVPDPGKVGKNGGGVASARRARVGNGVKPRAPRTSTPWGSSVVVEEAKVAQQTGEKRFTTVFQLLELRNGELLVRIAYTSDGVVRRGPVTMRRRDVERLNAALAARPRLAAALGRSEATGPPANGERGGGEAD